MHFALSYAALDLKEAEALMEDLTLGTEPPLRNILQYISIIQFKIYHLAEKLLKGMYLSLR